MEFQPSTGEPLNPFVGLFGRRQVRQIDAFFQPLRAKERRSAHGNRRVFLSDLFVAQLPAFYHPTVRCLRNPTVRSLRTLDALSRTTAAQTVLQVERLPRSTVSDAHALVDPTLLQPLLADLMQRVNVRRLPYELEVLVKRLVAVDGTFLRIVGDLTWTLRQHADNGRVVSKPRLDVQLDVADGVRNRPSRGENWEGGLGGGVLARRRARGPHPAPILRARGPHPAARRAWPRRMR